jgi:magnesium-transporting ATPase (P-type)
MSGDEGLLTGDDLSELQNGDLDARLETATVIARATPLDKLRIVESMQRRGHTVAMTGDGVNDAPALRLADVGGLSCHLGAALAHRNADVVLADDDFATLVDALVEGRSFWRNIRRALSLLLGGNLGELGLVVGATLLGYASPLTTRQILAVNLITDAFPALSVALQKPEHRRLASLAREGAGAMDKPLRNDVIRRGLLTTLPTLVSYIVTLSTGSIDQARAVAFAGIVTTQLAQTLDAGWSEGSLTKPVILAVGTSAGMMVASLTIPVLRSALQLAMPSFPAWLMITGGVGVALIGSRAAQANGKLPTSVELKNMLPKPQRLLTGPVTAGNGTAAGLAGT